MIKFSENQHLYQSTTPDNMEWISVSKLVSALCEPFDAPTQAVRSSNNKRSKWYGIDPAEIEQIWKRIGEDAVGKGKLYHLKREQGLYTLPNVVLPQYDSVGDKIAGNQRLQIGKVYPEHMVYMASVGICGQSDKMETDDLYIHVSDYKTNREIRRQGYTNWEGVSKKMYKPVAHLDDCEFNKYSLQLSLYLYMALLHSPLFEPGKLTIEHIKFEVAGEDKYGYPVYWTDANGDYIVKDIEYIEVPYRKSEVKAIVAWLKEGNNRNNVLNSKK